MSVIDPAAAESSASILFADVKGYSVLIQHDEIGTYERLKRARALFRQLVSDYGGRIVDEAGDGVLAAFGDPDGAVDFALAIQRDLANAAIWQGETGPFAFRIGIHAGPVRRDGEQPYGRTLIVARRIQEVAPAGRVCVSDTVKAGVAGRRDLRFTRLGLCALKNLPPTEVFCVEHAPASISAEPVSTEPVATAMETQPFGYGAAVAMLPLENLSLQPADDLLCDGMTMDIIERLSRFRELTVIARHSAFQCRALRDAPAEVGEMLGVSYLALGALRRAGDRLRITIQLLEAKSGRLLWSDRFDCGVGDVFLLQDEIADTIAARLASQLSAAERRRILAAREPKIGAYGLVLRGQELLLRYRRATNAHARRLFEEASALDSDYGRTYAGLARTFSEDWRYRWTDQSSHGLDQAILLARQAIAHDEQDSRGYAELGYAYLYQKRHQEALAAYERARELNPNDADVLALMTDALTCIGQPTRAAEMMQRAMRLNPCYPDWYLWYHAEALFDLEQYDAVIATLSRMHDPTEGQRLLAASHALLGRMEEARRHADEVRRAHPNFSLSEWRKVPPNVESPSQLRYFEGLRLAGLE